MRVHTTRNASTRFRTPSVSAMVAMTVVVVVLLAPACLLAEEFSVTVGPNGSNEFSPDTLNITLADTVRLTWASSHTLTRMDNGTSCITYSGPEEKGVINTQMRSEGYVYIIYPTAAGKAYLACSDHCEDGMRLALNVVDDGTPVQPPPQPPVTTSPEKEDKSDLPLILGSVCGALGLIIIAIGAFWFVRRTKKREEKKRLREQSLVAPHSPAPLTTSTGTSLSYSPHMTQQSTPHMSTGANLSMYIPQPGGPPSPGPPSPTNHAYNFYPPNTYVSETNQTVFTEGGANEVVIVPYTGQPAGPPQ